MTNILNGKTSSQNVIHTLPITCQICLGKVKEPCVCPNMHTFCSFCIDIWLEKTKHCPTCHVMIDKDNPCRKILGGIENLDNNDLIKPTDFSHPSTRKARFLNIFQQYEDEISRLNNFINSLNDEITKLKENNKNLGHGISHTISSPQHDMIQLLKNKLQILQKDLSDSIRERNELKEINQKYDNENSVLNLENARLKAALSDKNSQVINKYTITSLESKIENYDKEIKHLKKALEKSEKHIADLEFKNDLKHKENRLNRHLSEETFTSNSLNVMPSTSSYSSSSSSAFTYVKPSNNNSSSTPSSNKIIKPEPQIISKNDLKNLKFSSKIDRHSSINSNSPRKNLMSYGSPRKTTVHINQNDRLKKNNFNYTNVTSSNNFDLDNSNHLSQSMLTMNPNHTNNLLLSNSSNSLTNQSVVTNNLLNSSMKRFQIEEINLEKPESEREEEEKKKFGVDNLNGPTSEFIDCMEILNRAEKKVQNRRFSPRRDKILHNEKSLSTQTNSDSSSSSSSNGNSLNANGASSLSSFSNGTDSSFNIKYAEKLSSNKKESMSDKNPILVNSYSLNSYQTNSQHDIVYKEIGQSLNYGDTGINLSIVNRSRSVDTSNKFKIKD
ncbi:unnamed protein product [Brachionus calyciflorus]|uniref:RING-type domain-containing protein n=1 Tax=Brachionus calyciflorus TaxID=104777 RepID=A0A813N661_9BILA|nr:unnamed protein product [Brachionus calyciflorus]